MINKVIKTMKTTKMLKILDRKGSGIVTRIVNQVVQKGVIPNDWCSSIIVCYKDKGDDLEVIAGLINQSERERERAGTQLIRNRIKIDEMQFGFVQKRNTVDVIFTVKSLKEKHFTKNK